MSDCDPTDTDPRCRMMSMQSGPNEGRRCARDKHDLAEPCDFDPFQLGTAPEPYAEAPAIGSARRLTSNLDTHGYALMVQHRDEAIKTRDIWMGRALDAERQVLAKSSALHVAEEAVSEARSARNAVTLERDAALGLLQKAQRERAERVAIAEREMNLNEPLKQRIAALEADKAALAAVLDSRPFRPDPEPGETVLEEAARVVDGPRMQDYGHPLDNHSGTAAHWTTHLKQRGLLVEGAELTPEDVCWMNIYQKGSRDTNAPKRDNWTDTAGYARNIEKVVDERKRRGGLMSALDKAFEAEAARQDFIDKAFEEKAS